MGFNVYLGPLVNVEGATSISTISLVDVDVASFSSYIYLPIPWEKHTKTTVWGAPSLENPSCSKFNFRCSKLSYHGLQILYLGYSCSIMYLGIFPEFLELLEYFSRLK